MNEKVLIVDDSELDRFFVKKLLEYLNVDSEEVEDGEACFKAACTNKYALILMDYLMPSMTGIQTLSKMRANSNNKNDSTPVIALVSPDDPDEGKLCLEAGFSNYLDKPVDFKQLMAVLIMYLPEEYRDEIKLPTSDDRSDSFDNTDSMADKEQDIPESDVLKALSKITDIDYKKGISLCGSEDGYITALDIFYNSIDIKADEIENYYKDKDYKNYTIKVHALKSSANLIGAAKLWEAAKDLEDAGNNNDIDKIERETDALLSDYRSFKEKLSFMGSDDKDNKEPVSESALSDAYGSLSEFIEAMDFDLADMVIKSMKDYKLPDKDEQIFKELEKLLAGLNWDDMKKVMASR